MPERVFTTYVDWQHNRIFSDSWVHFRDYRFDRLPPRLAKCYIWRVESFTLEALVLEGYGTSAEAYITHEEAKYLAVFEPSKRVSLSDYPEEWAWWVTAGWNIYLTDLTDGRLLLHATSMRDSFSGGSLGAKKVRNPEKVRQFLRHLLYFGLHPIKAQKYQDQGMDIPDPEMQAMVRRLRKAHGSLPTKKRSAKKKEE